MTLARSVQEQGRAVSARLLDPLPGDVALFVSLGGGNWCCANYFRDGGWPVVQAKGTVLPAAGGTGRVR